MRAPELRGLVEGMIRRRSQHVEGAGDEQCSPALREDLPLDHGDVVRVPPVDPAFQLSPCMDLAPVDGWVSEHDPDPLRARQSPVDGP